MLLWVLLGIVAVVAIVLIAALVLPVVVTGTVTGGSDTGLAYDGSVMGFGGILGAAVAREGTGHRMSLMMGRFRLLTFSLPAEKLSRRDRPKQKKKKTAQEKKPPRSLRERLGGGLRQLKRYWPRVKQAYHDLWYVVHIDRFAAKITFGFADPALTGKLIGAIAVINQLLPRPFSIGQSFDFTRRVIRGELDVSVTVRLDRFWRRLFAYLPLVWPMIREQRRKHRDAAERVIAQEGV